MKFSDCKDYLISLGYEIENNSDLAYAMNMEASKGNNIMKYVKIEKIWECWARDVNVAIMPDVHAGKDCTVGTTMTIKDKVVPNLIN